MGSLVLPPHLGTPEDGPRGYVLCQEPTEFVDSCDRRLLRPENRPDATAAYGVQVI